MIAQTTSPSLVCVCITWRACSNTALWASPPEILIQWVRVVPESLRSNRLPGGADGARMWTTLQVALTSLPWVVREVEAYELGERVMGDHCLGPASWWFPRWVTDPDALLPLLPGEPAGEGSIHPHEGISSIEVFQPLRAGRCWVQM